MHFRYAFSDLAAGKSPDDPNWIVTRDSRALGSLPRYYSEDQKAVLSQICSQANIRFVAQHCKFPDWLGYLGLVLFHMHSSMPPYSALSKSWASQLAGLVSSKSELYSRLTQVAEGNGILSIQDLELE
jgi:hypothetical protein